MPSTWRQPCAQKRMFYFDTTTVSPQKMRSLAWRSASPFGSATFHWPKRDPPRNRLRCPDNGEDYDYSPMVTSYEILAGIRRLASPATVDPCSVSISEPK